jgi:hypothetical protein
LAKERLVREKVYTLQIHLFMLVQLVLLELLLEMRLGMRPVLMLLNGNAAGSTGAD